MSRNEDVTTGIWVDLMDLTPDAKLLYLWSFTNEHNGMSGLYKIHEAMIGVETGLSPDRISTAISELAAAGFAFYVDGVMFVRTRVKRLRTKSAQIAKSVARDVSHIRADHPLRVRFMDAYGAEKWLSEALADIQPVSLNRASREAQKNVEKPDVLVSLTGTSSEVPLSGSGLKEVDELLVYWKHRCAHPHAKLTPERRRAVGARLRQGYTAEQIRAAIDGAAVGAHVNERGKRFDDIELICRSGSKLESFIERGVANVVRLGRPEALRRADGWMDAPEYRGGAS